MIVSNSEITATDKWARSRSLLARAQQSLAGGVNSYFRAKAPVPLYFEDGSGCRLTDVDGNRYIDYSLAWGPLILGHRHPALVEALREQADKPLHYGAQHTLEIEVAEKFQSLVPCAERVIFCSSGTEAVQLALRLARAATGRNLILKFEGHYHGWADSILIAYHPSPAECGDAGQPNTSLGSRGQVLNAAENVLVAPWNCLDAIERLFVRHGDKIAGVITEPVLCNSGCLMPEPSYLEGLASLCQKHGALLIFDEVITGFRIDLGGAQTAFNVKPDIATFGKALGGGVTLSAVAGRREILELMCDGGVVFGGTFNGNPLGLAAARATLAELSRDNGRLLDEANRLGNRLKQGIERAAARHGISLVATGFGTAFSVHFTQKRELRNYRDTFQDDGQQLQRFVLAALAEGLYLPPDGRNYVSAVHDETVIEETIGAIDRTFERLTG